jgi:hypothetical protein
MFIHNEDLQMITLPAWFGRPELQVEALAKLDALPPAVSRSWSLSAIFDTMPDDLAAIHQATGFSVSFISLVDAVAAKRPEAGSKEFLRRLIGVRPGTDTAAFAESVVAWAVGEAVCRLGGDFMLQQARLETSLFPGFKATPTSNAASRKALRRRVRVAARLGSEPDLTTDPVTAALLTAIARLPAGSTGTVLNWLAACHADPDRWFADLSDEVANRIIVA